MMSNISKSSDLSSTMATKTLLIDSEIPPRLGEPDEQNRNIPRKWTAIPAAISALLLLLLLCTTFSYKRFHAANMKESILLINFIQQRNETQSGFSTPSDHSPLIPLKPSDLWGFTLASLGLILASGGGIGGGGMLVPIYILVLGFLPKHAIPLSNISVFGGAIANTWINVGRRHPRADRPLIDWDLIMVMEPATLFGALVGANLNKVLSETIIATMLVILLTFTAHSTFKKAFKMYRLETLELDGTKDEPLLNEYLYLDQNNMSRNDEEDDPDEYKEFRFNRTSSGGIHALQPIQLDAPEPYLLYNPMTQDGLDDNSTATEFDNLLLLEAIVEEERHIKPRNITLLIFMFLVVIIVNVLKGGGGYPSPIGVTCGSFTFWLSQVLLLLFIVGIAAIARNILIKNTQRKMDAGFRYLEEDIQWDKRSTIVYPILSSVAGFCAGMFGIGGGIVKGPLMLAMGVHPAVASATSACMILFTSMTATTTFYVYGMFVKDYAIVCMILGLLSTAFGQQVMSRMIKKTKRNSYIAFSIGVVVLLSALLMTLQSVLHMMSDEVDEEFSGICAAHLNGP